MAYQPGRRPYPPPRLVRPPPRPRPPVAPAPVGTTASAVTIGASLLLGLLLLLVASTIVLSLIPVYLPKQDIPGYNGLQTRSFRLSPNSNVPAYGTLPSATCNTIVQALAAAFRIPSSAITPVSCVVGTSAANTRGRRSFFFRRWRRADGPNVYVTSFVDCTQTGKCNSIGASGSTVGTSFSTSVILFGVPVSSFTIVGVQKSAYTSISTVNGTVSS